MENRRLDEDITTRVGDYMIQKEQQYSKELSEVRSHLEERVREVKNDLRDVKTDLKDDIQNVQENLHRVEENLHRVEDNLKNDLRDRISDLRWFIGIFVTGGIAAAGLIVTLLVKFLD